MNRGRARKGTCHSIGAHVACTRTYSGQGARKKIRLRMCTYGRGLERLLAHTYGQGSCTWLGRNGQTESSRVHGEATECVVFMGRQRNASCSWGGVWRTAKRRKRTSYGRNGGPVDREECGVPQNGGNGPPTVETGVLLIGRGVAYRKRDETDLCWSATVETGVLFIRRGVAYRKTGLHGILFISTIDLLQPPRARVHPATTGRYSTGYC